MPAAAVFIHVQGAGGAGSTPLADAWVYWRPIGSGQSVAVDVLRTDENGRALALAAGGDRTRPWDYTVDFTAQLNDRANIYFSRGAQPIPTAILTDDLFAQRTVAAAPAGQVLPGGAAPVNTGNNPNALSLLPAALIVIPNHVLSLSRPQELLPWPLLWELPLDNDLDPAHANAASADLPADYATAEFTQGSRLRWNTTPRGRTPIIGHASAAGLRENGASPAPPDEVAGAAGAAPRVVRPREQALSFEVAIDSRATGIRVQLLDRNGQPIPLRSGIERSSAVAADAAGAAAGAPGVTRLFRADVFFAHTAGQTGNTHAPAHFGLVQLVVRSEGMTPPIMESLTGLMCGFQITLVDDFVANAGGTQRGPASMEADEIIHVDFLNSAQPNLNTMLAQTRVRRMKRYDIRNRPRPLGGVDVMHPQMPLWMAEFQALGVNRAALEDLMDRRAYALALASPSGARQPNRLIIDLSWSLRLKWDGPDRARDPNSIYRHDRTFPANQRVLLDFDPDGRMTARVAAAGAGGEAEIADAFDDEVQATPFPVAGRRAARVYFVSQARPWGRFRGAAGREALVIEFQPRISEARNGGEVELIRGGDGRLSLRAFINDLATEEAPMAPAAVTADMRLPPFRVRGTNLNDADAEALIAALASDYYNNPAHAGQPQLAMLPEDAWEHTCRLIFKHETGGNYYQFDDRPSAVRFLARGIDLYYGNEHGMPFFGGPHGYGICQVDYGAQLPAGMTGGELLDEIWSVLENLRGGVKHVMGNGTNDKARAARAHLQGHVLADARRMQAVFQREVVRRYNGGSEFRWSGADWVIHPTNRDWEDSSDHSRGANTALLYPNSVLGAPNNDEPNPPDDVTYFVGNGVANERITGALADAQTQFPRPVNFVAANYGPGI